MPPTHFIVIDDDILNNTLCRYIMEKAEPKLHVQTFTIPENGFNFIVNEYSKTERKIPTVLLLDINMPSWSGWEFLDNFDKLDPKIKEQIKIYMFSSSVDPIDKERALKNRNVVDYIHKPLNTNTISNIILHYN